MTMTKIVRMSGDLSFPAQLLTVGKYLPVGGTQVGDLHLGGRGAEENRLVPEAPVMEFVCHCPPHHPTTLK